MRIPYSRPVHLHKQANKLLNRGWKWWPLRLLRKAAKLAAAAPEPSVHFSVLNQLAGLQDNPVRALDYRLAALDVVEQMRSRLLRDEYRVTAVRALIVAFEHAVADALAATDRRDWHEPASPKVTALELVERGRSRVFLELLGAAARLPLNNDDLVKAEEEALAAFDDALVSVRHIGGVDAVTRVRNARHHLNRVWDEIRASGQAGIAYANLRQGRPADYSELRALVAESGASVLAVYYVTDEETYLFLVRPDSVEPEVHIIREHRDVVRANVQIFLPGTKSGNLLGDDWDLTFQELVAPLWTACPPGESIWIVPHDALHRVPMHTVRRDGVPLFLEHPVFYTPSASVLRHCLGQGPISRRTPQVCAFSDASGDEPLTHARVQAASVADLSGGRAFHGPAATTAALANVMASESLDVLHLACHGVFDEDQPRRSAVRLADRRFTVEDIMRLRMEVRLVTLSACESGVSDRRPGDELSGLTAGLLHSGASSALVSLWKVDELSTAVLMREFYYGLFAGLGRAKALQRAQLSLRNATISALIGYCESSRQLLDPEHVITLDLDIAELRFHAGDYRKAYEDFTVITDRVGRDTAHGRKIHRHESQCLRAEDAANRRPLDYGRRRYSNPYYWAGFLLVGDGQ